jgi:hypothetical protein
MATTVREKIHKLLAKGGQHTAGEIARATRSSPNTVRRVLAEMARGKEISKLDEGRKTLYTLGELKSCKVCGKMTPRSYCSAVCVAERMSSMTAPLEPPKIKKLTLSEGERQCLRCERVFVPAGKDNWLCPSCRGAGVNILGVN